jgi:hypothetical protein
MKTGKSHDPQFSLGTRRSNPQTRPRCRHFFGARPPESQDNPPIDTAFDRVLGMALHGPA